MGVIGLSNKDMIMHHCIYIYIYKYKHLIIKNNKNVAIYVCVCVYTVDIEGLLELIYIKGCIESLI